MDRVGVKRRHQHDAGVLAYSTFKKKARKKKAGDSPAMLALCRDQPCYLKIDGICRGGVRQETVVPCHANELALGKGKGLKVPDKYTVPGCMDCHSWLDAGLAPREEKRLAWRRAYSVWSMYRDGEEDVNVSIE
jgi:hypothetical protein